MENSYIRDYICNLLENTYNDDLERLKAISYGLEYILNNLQYQKETNNDIYNYNRLTTCLITINEIIKENKGDVKKMINWEKIKENYSLEDFCNIIGRNKPNKNSKLYKEWLSLYQDIIEELDKEEERPKECEILIDEAIDFLKEQRRCKKCLKNGTNL